eukprot:5442146-Pleurochrysis_carterae.AAC.1
MHSVRIGGSTGFCSCDGGCQRHSSKTMVAGTLATRAQKQQKAFIRFGVGKKTRTKGIEIEARVRMTRTGGRERSRQVTQGVSFPGAGRKRSRMSRMFAAGAKVTNFGEQRSGCGKRHARAASMKARDVPRKENAEGREQGDGWTADRQHRSRQELSEQQRGKGTIRTSAVWPDMLRS